MIEVIGPDGRVHNFADGTSQAQIDAAMAAIYDAPPPAEPPAYDKAEAPRSNKMLIASAAVAGVLSLVALAYFLGRGAPAPAPEATTTAPPAVVATTDTTNGVAPIDPNAAPPLAPGAPAVVPEAFMGYVATAQGGNLTVRQQPQTTAPEVTKLPHGAPITVKGSVMMPDGLWREVSLAGATGFVKGEYVSQTQPAPIARPTPPPAQKVVRLDFWGVISTMNSGSVNLRATPSTSAASIASLAPGTEVRVVGEQGNWYSVSYKGRQGWVRSDLIVAYD
jgi:uncharacterized protein YraI